MRQYFVDEISFLERDNIENYLKRTLKAGPIEGVFWLEVPSNLLSSEQKDHEQCAPFYFSIVLEGDSLRCEFLVRNANNLHCSCITWATPAQRQLVMDFTDQLLEEEMIKA